MSPKMTLSCLKALSENWSLNNENSEKNHCTASSPKLPKRKTGKNYIVSATKIQKARGFVYIAIQQSNEQNGWRLTSAQWSSTASENTTVSYSIFKAKTLAYCPVLLHLISAMIKFDKNWWSHTKFEKKKAVRTVATLAGYKRKIL